MIYRILAAPPGYPPLHNYMVAAYATLEYGSCLGNVRKADGTLFAVTLEEARSLLPADAKRLPFEPKYQFLELWESDGGTANGDGFRRLDEVRGAR
jgi:hypothetical protein